MHTLNKLLACAIVSPYNQENNNKCFKIKLQIELGSVNKTNMS